MIKKYITSAIFLCIVILWAFNVPTKAHNMPIKEEDVEIETIEPTPTPCHYDIDMDYVSIEDIIHNAPTPTPQPTPTPTIEPIVEEEEWLCYLATAYNSDKPNPCGNRGELLTGRKAIAMWQSDTDYSKYYSMVEPYKSFLTNKELAKKYGALPYGTKVEMRMWSHELNDYRYMGIYEVLDDSPTTIYNLSEVAQSLKGETGILTFNYKWGSIDYQGRPISRTTYKGWIPNWKEEYSGKVIGWLDIWQGTGSMPIVEIRIVN